MIIARLLALILGAALTVPATVLAQAYPSRPIELIIPFAPGGPTDIAIRLIQPQLSANLGVPVVLVNKAGGGGAIGMDQVAKAKPDGYTLAATVRSTITILPATQADVPYKPADFIPVGAYAFDSGVVLVKRDAPWKTLEELVGDARKNPGKLTYGTAGLGTNSFFNMELLKQAYNIEMTHVPFGGSGPVKNAVLGGHVQLGCGLAEPHALGGEVGRHRHPRHQRVQAPRLPARRPHDDGEGPSGRARSPPGWRSTRRPRRPPP